MSGGKETPRQKMIGMMYLVLTALLALNVSKQIIAAFITLNDKLDASAEIIHAKNEDTYFGFDQKRAAIIATKGDMVLLDRWDGKAHELKKETALIVSFLLGECNEMIKEAEGVDWIEEKDDEGNIIKLKPLQEILNFDNYDIPTGMFVGSDAATPKKKGLDIRVKVLEYRDKICVLMGTYEQGKNKKWSFTAPSSEDYPKFDLLHKALESCNPEDTAKIASFYKALTLPKELEAHEHGPLPWPSVIFDHAPIVAAAAMFTALKLDIKNAESVASEYMLSKVEAPMFNFNKIEPLAFARTGYINQGDSLNLNVMIAAYDSTEVSTIRYGIDADTLPENWKEVTGTIGLPGNQAGDHRVKGQIGVKEKGEISWKNWDFNYTVGQPMGVVALPEMNVLYKGYDNKVTGTASGYDPATVTLSGSGTSISRKGEVWIARPSKSVKTAYISVSAKKLDGSTVSLGKFEFRVRNLPPPSIYLGGIQDGETIKKSVLKVQTRLFAKYDASIPLNATFSIKSWTLGVTGAPREEKGSGANLTAKAKGMLKQAQPGQTVTIMCRVMGPDGIARKKSGVFKVK